MIPAWDEFVRKETIAGLPYDNVVVRVTHYTAYNQALPTHNDYILQDSLTGNQTFDQCMDRLYLGLTTLNYTNEFSFDDFIMFIDGNQTGQIVASQFQIKFNVMSKLRVQNRTKADGAGSENQDSENITNNPLHGIAYTCYGNALKPRRKSKAHTMVGSKDAGYVAESFTGTLASDEFYVKPPFGQAFSGVVKQGKPYLDPGAIKTDYLRFKKSMYLNAFIRKHYSIWQDLDTPGKSCHTFGMTSVLGLEKLLDVNPQGENAIQIGWELEAKFLTSYRYRTKVITRRRTDVVDAPVIV